MSVYIYIGVTCAFCHELKPISDIYTLDTANDGIQDNKEVINKRMKRDVCCMCVLCICLCICGIFDAL